MLVLTRKPGEIIRIGDDITVIVQSVEGNQIRLAIDASKEIPIYRDEIYQRIQKEKESEHMLPHKAS